MEIIDLSNTKENKYKTGIALGNFDGIHLGHQNLIKTMIDNANDLGLKSSILLFKNHTRKTINKDEPRHITSMEQKIKIIESLGVEIIYLLDFNENLMKLSPEEFIENILIEKMNSKLVVVGFDYRFGYKAKGDIDYLVNLANKLNFKVKVLAPIKNEGNINANNYGMPKTGVYKTLTVVDNKEYLSATNIGYNPTFENKDLKFETHILDFNQNIYGKTIEVKFISYIRDDIKFNNKQELIEQMKIDVKKIRA